MSNRYISNTSCSICGLVESYDKAKSLIPENWVKWYMMLPSGISKYEEQYITCASCALDVKEFLKR